MRIVKRIGACGACAAMLLWAQNATAQATRENPADVSNRRIPWTIPESPKLEIGSDPSRAATQLFGVVGGAFLGSEEIAIASGRTSEVEIFDRAGNVLRILGRRGEGPGEFQRIASFGRSGEGGLYIFDEALRRVTTFSEAKELSGTFDTPSGLGIGKVYRTNAGVWFARRADRTMPALAGRTARDTVVYYRSDARFEEAEELARVPGLVTASVRLPTGDIGNRAAPFTPSPTQAILGSCLVVADAESWDLTIFSSSGSPVRAVSNTWTRPRVTGEATESWRTALLDAVPAEARSIVEPTFRRIGMPEFIPAVHDLVVDAFGYIWMQRFTPPFGLGKEWLVFRPDGVFAGGITTPVPLMILEIGEREILAVARNELDEELVRVYELQRPVGAPGIPAECR